MAAFMSTIGDAAQLGKLVSGGGFYRRFMRRDASEKHYVNISRIATLLLSPSRALVSARLATNQPGMGSGAGGGRGNRRRLFAALVLVARECLE